MIKVGSTVHVSSASLGRAVAFIRERCKNVGLTMEDNPLL